MISGAHKKFTRIIAQNKPLQRNDFGLHFEKIDSKAKQNQLTKSNTSNKSK